MADSLLNNFKNNKSVGDYMNYLNWRKQKEKHSK